jgi:predicted hydrocarbon binding protein
MFKEERENLMFNWSMLGNVAEGRPNLGNIMDVNIYRLMQYTLRDVLIKKFGPETSDNIFYEAGQHAGKSFCLELLNKNAGFNDFIVDLQEKIEQLKIGILRVEKADMDNMTFTLTIAEDLDCSGLPVVDEEICTYDEGFINGVLLEYTGKNFKVKEVDCWCSGDRVCRFDIKLNA